MMNFLKDWIIQYQNKFSVGGVETTIDRVTGTVSQEGDTIMASYLNEIQKNCIYQANATRVIEGVLEIYDISIDGSEEFAPFNQTFLIDFLETNTKVDSLLRFNGNTYSLRFSDSITNGDIAPKIGFIPKRALVKLDVANSKAIIVDFNPNNFISPAFTGTPTAPTAPVGANSTQIATTAFVANTAVKLTGDQTIAGVKTFSSNIVGNITGNSGTATKLSTTRANYKGTTDSVVVGELMWKANGNGHTIFDASASATPTGASANNTNPDIPWSATYPTLMGYNGTNTYGVRVDSARVAEAFTTAVGSAPSYACRAWVNFNGTGAVAIRASGNVSSITDNGVGDYTVNFTTAMIDASYGLSGSCKTVASDGRVVGLHNSVAPSASSVRIQVDKSQGGLLDSDYVLVSIFR